jgi:arylformamidase
MECPVDRTPYSLIDLSHTIENGMITYPGLPGPVLSDHLSRKESRSHYSEGTEFHIGKIEMVANTGTYIDSPYHRFADSPDLSELPLATIANLEGMVLRVGEHDGRKINALAFSGLDVRGKAVLIHTGWDVHWRTERYGHGHPFLSENAARWLVSEGAALVGIDSLNIDDTADGRRPAHTLLLKVNIPIVEHLCNLEDLPDSGFRFFAVPAPVKGLGSFPVRAFAIMNENY